MPPNYTTPQTSIRCKCRTKAAFALVRLVNIQLKFVRLGFAES